VYVPQRPGVEVGLGVEAVVEVVKVEVSVKTSVVVEVVEFAKEVANVVMVPSGEEVPTMPVPVGSKEVVSLLAFTCLGIQ